MKRAASVAFTLLLILGALLAPPAGATADDGGMRLDDTQEFDRTEFHIQVYENGSARWTFLYQESLENQSQRQQFQEFAEEFNENETDLYTGFQQRAESLTAGGTNVTGRDMEARNFSRNAQVNELRNQGQVRMSFVWTNFAVEDGERLVIGDVFEGGLYVGPNQRLVIETGPNLRIVAASPPPDFTSTDSVTWEGEEHFTDNRPEVRFGPASDGGTPIGTATPPPGTESVGPPGPDGGGLTELLGLFALALVALLGVGAAFAYRAGYFGDDGDDGAATGSEASGGDGPGGDGMGGQPAVTDEELLSDDRRVLNLLEERGGRMKQVNIVEETGWSKSKVSMLLTDMEEDDQISKLRVGRENIISIKGQEPEAAGSPFKDE